MRPLILASTSPRRRELLSSLGFDFDIVVHDVDENGLDHLKPAERVVALALAKARSAVADGKSRAALVIGADTLVADPLCASGDDTASLQAFADDSGAFTLGKAEDRNEARTMMAALAGRVHAVHSGLAVVDASSGRSETALSTSLVRFAPLSEREIEDYLDTGEWQGVAGAYRIQGRAAYFIEEIRGSWSGIVGLPIRELYVIFTRLGIETPALKAGKFPPLG